MDAGSKSFLLQRQLKQEMEQVQSYLHNLQEWSDEMNERESKALRVRRDEIFSDELDWPIRLKSIISAQSEADRLRERGNDYFRNKQWNQAIEMYSACIVELRVLNDKSDANELSIAYSNRAAAYLKAKKYDKCVEDCTFSIKFNPSNDKAYFRRGMATMSMGKRKKAAKDWRLLIQLYQESKNQSKIAIAQKMLDKCERKKKKSKTDDIPTEEEILSIDSFLSFEKMWNRYESRSLEEIRVMRCRLLSLLCSELSGKEFSQMIGTMATQQLLSDFIDCAYYLIFQPEWDPSLMTSKWNPNQQSNQQRMIDAFNMLSKFRSLDRFAMIAAFLTDHSTHQLSEMRNHLLNLFTERESFLPKIQAVFDAFFI